MMLCQKRVSSLPPCYMMSVRRMSISQPSSDKKMKKAYKEPQEKNDSQKPNNEIKIDKALNSFLNTISLNTISEFESESTPNMQPGSKEL